MANSYTQIHIQAVFAVKYREGLLHREWRDELLMYLNGTMRNLNHKVLALNGVEDHVHIFFGMNPDVSVSKTLQIVKGESSEWINKRKFCRHHFEWQSGYGAFSYRKSDVPEIIKYVRNQAEHHKHVSFIEEYKALLTEFDVQFDERYILKEPISYNNGLIMP
jgi:putative transposase